MTRYSLAHLSDGTLLRDLHALVARDRATTAQLLAHLAEVDERRLYLSAGYPSMYAWCVGELRLSEDAAYKRIQAARAARQFPALFIAVAEGRLNLTGVGLLAPHLTPDNSGELLRASAGKSKVQIEELLARRFPRAELLPMVESLPSLAPESDRQLAPAQVGRSDSEQVESSAEQLSPGTVELPGRKRVQDPGPRTRLSPVARERYALQLTIAQSTHDKLRYAQALLSHQVPNGDLSQVLDRALDALICKLEKQKFSATDAPHDALRSTRGGRHIPAHAKRAVWQRDQGRCTFVSATGQRCGARKFLEFDHVTPVAQDGNATTANLRLRCRAHNQYAAERTFGAEFIRHKRQEARERARQRRARLQAKEQAELQQREHAKEQAQEVIPWLRALGFRADEARWRAERCEATPDASLEERVKLALSYLSPRIASRGRGAPAPAGGVP